MKKLLLMTLLLGAAFATQAQRRGNHQPPPSRHGHGHYDDCDDDRRGRGHYKHAKYRDRRDYRRDDCRDERVVVVRRPGIPLPPPPPIFIPRPPRVTGVIVIR